MKKVTTQRQWEHGRFSDDHDVLIHDCMLIDMSVLVTNGSSGI